MTRQFLGFGFDPSDSAGHFYVIVPKDRREPVEIYERFQWDAEGEQIIHTADTLKLRFPRHKWSLLQADAVGEFNSRLKEQKRPTARFTIGGTPIDKLLGKELLVLLWAVENNDPRGIPTAIRNWKGLRPEERWWLYTMTNARTGNINDKRGWRMALRYALCENPIDESDQITIDELLGGSTDE